MNQINESYERLANEGRVGIRFEPGWGLRRDLFSMSGETRPPDCARGGCHRPASGMAGGWLVCLECGDAIEGSR